MKFNFLIVLILNVFIVNAQAITKPIYKGGNQGIVDLIGHAKQELRYDHCFMTTVAVSFNIDTLGRVDSIKVEEGINTGGADILIDVLKKTSGNWQPATNNGQPINYRNTYVYFFSAPNKDDCDNSKFWFSEGIKLFNKEKYKAAAKDFTKALEFNNGDADTYYYRALAQLKSADNIKEACSDFDYALRFGKVEAKELMGKNCK